MSLRRRSALGHYDVTALIGEGAMGGGVSGERLGLVSIAGVTPVLPVRSPTPLQPQREQVAPDEHVDA